MSESIASVESISIDTLSPTLYSVAPCFDSGNQPSLLEIEPQSSILRPEVLRKLKLALLSGKSHITPTFTLSNPSTADSHCDSSNSGFGTENTSKRDSNGESLLSSVKQEKFDSQSQRIRSRSDHVTDICSNGFDEYRPAKRTKLGSLPQPSADILHDKELAALWIARELVQFAQDFVIVDDSECDEESESEESESEEMACSSHGSGDELPGDVPGLERPDSSDSVDSFTSTDADRLMTNIQASFGRDKSSGAPSPVQRPIPIARHPLSLFSPSLASMHSSSAFRSISFDSNSLSLFAGQPSTAFTNSLSYTGNSPSLSSLYPQWGSTSSAFTSLTSTCFTNASLQLGKSSSDLYPQQNSGAFSIPAPPQLCPASSTAASVMMSLAFST